MADNWRELREAFERIEKRGDLRADHCPGGWGGIAPQWGLVGDATAQNEFRLIARAAAELAEYATGPAAWLAWLDRLLLAEQQDDSDWQLARWRKDEVADVVVIDLASIPAACRASVHLCSALAAGFTLSTPAPLITGASAPPSRLGTNSARVDAYIDEVRRKTGKIINRKSIWSLYYEDSSDFLHWQRGDGKATKKAHARFEEIFVEKPHLK